MRIEKKVAAPDSATLARRDSIYRADSLRRADSLSMLSKSSLEMPVFSTARDTMVEVFSDGQRKIYYYGDVSVKYQDMELTADYMEYDMKSGTVYARGTYDSLKGEWVGRPKMTQGNKTYDMHELRYNFNSRKSRISNMVTSEDEGILRGRNIKMMDDNSINITKGQYTVCDAEHPHYYLSLSAAKVVQNPSRKTIFGPACLVIEDVKLPFVGIPFGFIPKRPQRATGLLMPTFGEEQARGFYMRGLGMYFVFGDHLDLQVTGDYYTLGSWALNVSSRYNVRYKFNGGFNITFSIGNYTESSYGVMQAVADSPMGPFRKLSDGENGMILSNDLGENHAVGGPGHHSFFTVNIDGEEKLMIAYHAHTNLYTYADRAVRFDEVKWVTVEGKDGEQLDVMHVNGPTVTTQPAFGIGEEYGDVSGAMESIELVRGELAEGSSADSMIDGLFSAFIRSSREFEEKYVRETSIVQTSTFEVTLESPRELRGIMFYNSNSDETAFESVKNIAFICEENGTEKVYVIPELKYNYDCNHIWNEVSESYYIIFGGGCYAEFASLANVKAIRFTVEVPEGKESVGVSEVALVGRFANAQG